MKIDLEDKVIRFVAQEYVNAIVNFESQAELDYDVHKLIHTFTVVQVAQQLIDLSIPKLSVRLKRQILDAAVLHDVGRCYELKNKSKNFDHGDKGYALIQKKFPLLIKEQLSTKWHNKAPSDDDPIEAQPILDYTRDADMLGNLRYNIDKMPVFLKHILQNAKKEQLSVKLGDEIIFAASQERPYRYQKMVSFLDMMLAQLLWIYNLRTQAGFLLAKKERLFPRYRDVIISDVLPAISGTQKQKEKLAQQICELFPDKMFLKEFSRHGL